MTPFEIVLVPFPFADLTSTKRRPCLILSSFRPRSMNLHLIVAMITSQVMTPGFPFDVKIQHFDKAGLPKPSLVRLSKIVTLDSTLITKKLGVLDNSDCEIVIAEFKKLFSSFVKE